MRSQDREDRLPAWSHFKTLLAGWGTSMAPLPAAACQSRGEGVGHANMINTTNKTPANSMVPPFLCFPHQGNNLPSPSGLFHLSFQQDGFRAGGICCPHSLGGSYVRRARGMSLPHPRSSAPSGLRTTLSPGGRDPARLQWCAARQTAQPDATSVLGAWHQADAERGRVPPQGHHTPPHYGYKSVSECPSSANWWWQKVRNDAPWARTLLWVMARATMPRFQLFGHQVVIPTSLSHGPFARFGSLRGTFRSLPMYYN